LRVASLQENSRITTGLAGPVKIGGDIKAGQALEDYLLDHIVFTLETASNSGIQRPAIVGQTADHGQKRLADPLLPAFRVRDVVDFRNGAFPPLQLLLGDLVHPPEEGILRGLLSRERQETKKSRAQEADLHKFHMTGVERLTAVLLRVPVSSPDTPRSASPRRRTPALPEPPSSRPPHSIPCRSSAR